MFAGQEGGGLWYSSSYTHLYRMNYTNMVFTLQALRPFFRQKLITTLQELKQILGTTSTMTVFRKLKTLGYRTSYSHRGKYYTLTTILFI